MKPECESKIRLLNTACDLIWRSSYGSVSVDDICAKADVKKGSFYYFFKSKADLSIAAIEAHWNEIQPVVEKTFSPDVPPLERFERYFTIIEDVQREKKKLCGHVLGCPFASLGAELSTLDENIRAKSVQMSKRMAGYIESAIIDAQKQNLITPGDPTAKAESLLSFVMGLLFQARIHDSLEPLSHLRDGGLRIIGARVEVAA